MTHTHAKGRGQMLVGSKNKVETDGRTDGGDCSRPISGANAVGNYRKSTVMFRYLIYALCSPSRSCRL